ncbi:MAG: hypothetical protein MHMPM18_000323 [Marteilia pararefringens]
MSRTISRDGDVSEETSDLDLQTITETLRSKLSSDKSKSSNAPFSNVGSTSRHSKTENASAQGNGTPEASAASSAPVNSDNATPSTGNVSPNEENQDSTPTNTSALAQRQDSTRSEPLNIPRMLIFQQLIGCGIFILIVASFTGLLLFFYYIVCNLIFPFIFK